MFRYFPKSMFWLATVLIGGCLLAAEVTGFGGALDPLALHGAAFGFLGLLAASAYPFTRGSQLFVGLALIASLVGIARIAFGADSSDAIRIWLAAISASLAALMLVATIRKLFGRRLALPAPDARQPWHSHIARPALLASLALAVGVLFSPRPLIEVVDNGVLRIPLSDIIGVDEGPADQAAESPRLTSQADFDQGKGARARNLTIAVLPDDQLLPQLDRITALGVPDLRGSGNPPPKASAGGNASLGSLKSLEYDLGGQLRSNGTIEVSKPLKIADRDTGELTLLIDPNSQIFADSGQISAIMPDLAGSLETTNGKFVSFAELRRSGIAISYDAVRDVVVIAN